MAIEYTFYSAATLDEDALLSGIAGSLGATISPDESMARDGLWVVAYLVEPGEEAKAALLFGFPHRVTAVFRFSSTRLDLEARNTALMLGAVLGLSHADGVLLFNGEEAVVRISEGEVTFSSSWEDWDDMPEVVGLKREHAVAPIPQPLL